LASDNIIALESVNALHSCNNYRLKTTSGFTTNAMPDSYAHPPSAAQSTAEDIPTILVEDYTQEPIITTKYLCGENELDFKEVYTKVTSLPKHPRCTHDPIWPCEACSSAFNELYWASAALLLDYMADFLPYDTSLMQSVWFYLIDIWQESTGWFPCEEVERNLELNPKVVAAWVKARWVRSEFTATVELMNQVIFGLEGAGMPKEPIIHPPSGDARNAADEYNTGPYISGLSPWQQWLCEDSPGVATSASSLPSRHVPMGAIAIMKTHTERVRRLAEKFKPGDKDFLRSFDQHSLKSPTASSPTQTHHSRLTGKTVTYRLSNGAPPVQRYAGIGDTDMVGSNPDFNLLDDCVGLCKGQELYKPVSGEEGDGDEEAQSVSTEEVGTVFDVWVVCETNADEHGKSALAEEWQKKLDE
jgi:hypothetical protein